MKTIKVNTVVLGATYAGLGYAVARPDSLILEISEFVGCDYAMTYRPVLGHYQAETKPGRELETFLKDKKVVKDDGRLDRLRLTTVIARYCDLKQLNVLLDAVLIEIQQQASGGFLLKSYTNNGIRLIEADQVLDTSGECISDREAVVVRRKLLNVVCSECEESDLVALAGKWPGLEIEPGYLKDEWTLRFPFSPDTSIMDARRAIEDSWKEIFSGKNILIDSIAFDFEVLAERKKTEDLLTAWLTPQLFKHPLEAFEAGYELAQSGRQPATSGNEVYDAVL